MKIEWGNYTYYVHQNFTEVTFLDLKFKTRDPENGRKRRWWQTYVDDKLMLVTVLTYIYL